MTRCGRWCRFLYPVILFPSTDWHAAAAAVMQSNDWMPKRFFSVPYHLENKEKKNKSDRKIGSRMNKLRGCKFSADTGGERFLTFSKLRGCTVVHRGVLYTFPTLGSFFAARTRQRTALLLCSNPPWEPRRSSSPDCKLFLTSCAGSPRQHWYADSADNDIHCLLQSALWTHRGRASHTHTRARTHTPAEGIVEDRSSPRASNNQTH